MTTYVRDEQPKRTVNSIADDYCDLLSQLDEGKRLGMIQRLSVGYYEGWAPSRAELSTLVDFELGRISEAEFFATGQPAPGRAPAQHGLIKSNTIRSMPSSPTQVGNPAMPAVFHVDCGELSSRLRFVATRLRGAGWTVREDVNYRLVFLDYELLPVKPADLEKLVGAGTIPFGGAIRCVPDVPAPWSFGDGRSVRHIARPQGISGTRGPWPVADGARLIKFVISRQPSSGKRSMGGPAGVLTIDVARGHAAWQAVGGGRVSRAVAN